MKWSLIFSLSVFFIASELFAYSGKPIPFQLVNGLIIIEASIDGEMGQFILDSGSNGLIVDKNTSSGGSFSYATTGGEIKGFEKEIDRLEIGNFEHRKLKAFYTDLASVDSYTNLDIAGIIGFHLFKPKTLVFDFEAKLLQISDQNVNPSAYGLYHEWSFELKDDIPITTIQIKEHTFQFILDSGASSHFIDEELLNNLDVPYHMVHSTSVTNAGGSQSDQSVILFDQNICNDVYSKRFVIQNFEKLSEEFHEDIHGLLSLSSLSSGIIIMSIDQKKLFF